VGPAGFEPTTSTRNSTFLLCRVSYMHAIVRRLSC
jgi:hypothetical protein